jgi:hypothetical protein
MLLTYQGVFKVKGKGKFVLAHAMKVYRGRRGIAPIILELGTT